jgi:hypothetical protein
VQAKLEIGLLEEANPSLTMEINDLSVPFLLRGLNVAMGQNSSILKQQLAHEADFAKLEAQNQALKRGKQSMEAQLEEVTAQNRTALQQMQVERGAIEVLGIRLRNWRGRGSMSGRSSEDSMKGARRQFKRWRCSGGRRGQWNRRWPSVDPLRSRLRGNCGTSREKTNRWIPG